MGWTFRLFLTVTGIVHGQNKDVDSHSIVVPKSTPSNAVSVPADFFGFGFESGFLPHYNNEFSHNVVSSIQNRTSKPLVIRVGGTSGDNITVHEDQKDASHCTSKFCTSLSHFDVGPSYFDTLKGFPDVSWSIQAPMGPHLDMTNTMLYLKHAWEKLGKDRVSAIALGNEPNWYHLHDKGYDYATYTKDSIEIEDRVIKEFGLKDDESQIFQVGEIASEAVSSDFNLIGILKDRLGQNGRTKYVAEHFYQHAEPEKDKSYFSLNRLQEVLMSPANILDHLKPYENVVDWLREKKKPYPLVLSEVGSAIGGSPLTFGGSFGAAMWAVNFHLAAMAHGVQRVCNTMGPGATHAFWEPDNSGRQAKGPAVNGIFPAAAYIADFVGKDDDLGRVTELSSGVESLTAYAMYGLKSDKPTRVALINLHEWHEDDTPALSPKRGAVTVTLDVGEETKSVTIQRMQSEKGSTALGFDQSNEQGRPWENVTWAGEQWSHKVDMGKGHFVSGPQEEKAKVSQGKVRVVVPDTEAVIVFLS